MILKGHGRRPVNDFVLFPVDKALKERQINAIAFKCLITCAIDVSAVVQERFYILKECGEWNPDQDMKLEALRKLINEKHPGEKVIIFTQFAEMGSMLRYHLQETFGCEVFFLHGGSPKKERDRMISRFQNGGPPLFILSLKAGGLGLNLTAANHVFHFDRWWNPAVENQATDRVFRIGQKKNVEVHKFISMGTLEERIDEMIEQKKQLADLVIGTGESWLTELSTNQLRELFKLSSDAVRDD